jgi:hypothetical protein
LVAVRLSGRFAKRTVYRYETESETSWAAPYPETKMRTRETVQEQIKSFPYERSARAHRALATLCGATAGCFAAEAFVLARQIS